MAVSKVLRFIFMKERKTLRLTDVTAQVNTWIRKMTGKSLGIVFSKKSSYNMNARMDLSQDPWIDSDHLQLAQRTRVDLKLVPQQVNDPDEVGCVAKCDIVFLSCKKTTFTRILVTEGERWQLDTQINQACREVPEKSCIKMRAVRSCKSSRQKRKPRRNILTSIFAGLGFYRPR